MWWSSRSWADSRSLMTAHRDLGGAPCQVRVIPLGKDFLDLSPAERRALLSPDSKTQVPPEELEAHESVFSLRELEPGLVLAGLKGIHGRPEVRLIRVRADERPRIVSLDAPEFLGSLPVAGNRVNRNPVWSLGLDRQRARAGEDHVVIAGCDDGQVWRLVIPRREQVDAHLRTTPPAPPPSGRAATEDLPAAVPGSIRLKAERVGRLGSPVWATGHSRVPGTPADGSEARERIFAGTADGTLLAWQRVEVGGRGEWIELWATREQGAAIARIHTLQHVGPLRGGDPRGAVLALTHKGRAVLVSDRDALEAPSDRGEDHQDLARRRLMVPGLRVERLDLGAPVLASDVLRVAKTSGWESLQVASNDGRLRVITPRYLKGSRDRKQEFDELNGFWREAVVGGRLHSRQLRMVEALGSAAPSLPFAPVRELLRSPAGLDSDEAEPPPWRRFFLPRHLRILGDIRVRWLEAERGDGGAGPESSEQAEARLEASVKALLRRLRRRGERALFDEVIDQLLAALNRRLLDLRHIDEAEAGRIRAILRGVGLSAGLWVGDEEGGEVRARIRVAKALLDGATFKHLAGLAGPAAGVLEERVTQVRTMLDLGDDLLTLEVTQAVNLSITRGILFARADVAGRVPPESWEKVLPFFQALTSSSARAGHSGGGLDDATAHQVARAYALLATAYPERVVFITHLLSEATLGHEFMHRVRRQIVLLGALGIETQPKMIELFENSSGAGRARPHFDASVALVTHEPEPGEVDHPHSNSSIIEA